MLQMTNWRLRGGGRAGKAHCCKGKAAVSSMKRKFVLPVLFHQLKRYTFPSHRVTFCAWQKRLTEIVTKLVGIKKERMWTMSSTLIWSLTIQFFPKTKAPVHAGRERATEISLHLAQGSPFSRRALDTWSSLALELPENENCQFWVFTKNYQHLCLRVATEPASLQPMKSLLGICHITSLTSQRFSDPLSQSVVDLHMGTLWLLIPQ